MSKDVEKVSIKFKLPTEMYLKFKRICEDQMQPMNDFFRQKVVEVLSAFGCLPGMPGQEQEEQEPTVDMVVQGFKPDEQEPEQITVEEPVAKPCKKGGCKHKHVDSSGFRWNNRSRSLFSS
jgi:hypothetical protein